MIIVDIAVVNDVAMGTVVMNVGVVNVFDMTGSWYGALMVETSRISPPGTSTGGAR